MVTIDYENVEFYVNEDKRKTVAVIRGCSDHAYQDILSERSTSVDLSIIDLMSIPEEVLMPDVIKATSTCHTTDNWDPEVGKKQAFFKLLRSYNKMKSRAINRLIMKNTQENATLSEIDRKYNKNVDHYNKLVRYPKESKR